MIKGATTGPKPEGGGNKPEGGGNKPEGGGNKPEGGGNKPEGGGKPGANRGTWNPTGTYQTGDRVTWDGKTYEAVQSHTGSGDERWIYEKALWREIGPATGGGSKPGTGGGSKPGTGGGSKPGTGGGSKPGTGGGSKPGTGGGSKPGTGGGSQPGTGGGSQPGTGGGSQPGSGRDRGTWNPTGTYQAGDIVTWEGKRYRAVQPHTGSGAMDWITARSIWEPI